MRVFLVLAIIALFDYSLAEDSQRKITCDDISHNPAGWIIDHLSYNDPKLINVKFYLSTNQKQESVLVNVSDWSQLQSSGFDVTKKTFFITHGYLSGGQKPWVIDMKDALLETRDGNVFIVDWSDGGNKKNYVNAAKNTVIASNRVFNFLQQLRFQIGDQQSTQENTAYNHLHLIGHSLGAQISGQTAYLLKQDSFWVVDRITGLDPAKPCFSNVDSSLRVDQEHAAFVDVVHTNMGVHLADSLGLARPLGHVDFYMNGGMIQPECQDQLIDVATMVCSHSLSTIYFTESIRNSKTGSCKFPIQRWTGSYTDAQIRIALLKSGANCDSCPSMGIDSVKSQERGIFLVLTATYAPYCKFNADRDLPNILPGIQKLIGMEPVTEYAKPSATPNLTKLLIDPRTLFLVQDLLPLKSVSKLIPSIVRK